MSDGEVAAGALESGGLAVNDVAVDGGGDAFVTMATGVLGDFVVELCDLDGVGIPAGREVEGMPESVVGLDGVFSENVVRGVAVVTGRGRVMARLQPGIVLRAHDVAVGAGGRIVGEVGVSLGVDEGEEAEAEEEAERDSEQERVAEGGVHLALQTAMREIAKGVDARRSMFQVAEWMDGSDDNIRRR